MSGEQLSRLDLFNVSEIKKVKGGGLEIKFFDRQKALERMYEYASSADSGATARSLLAALAGGGDGEDGV
ncbi:terminase small subunit [Ruminococcus sp. CAG:379]|nr:terminase small subunit [Ruminococcus sp. CAG:379]